MLKLQNFISTCEDSLPCEVCLYWQYHFTTYSSLILLHLYESRQFTRVCISVHPCKRVSEIRPIEEHIIHCDAVLLIIAGFTMLLGSKDNSVLEVTFQS